MNILSYKKAAFIATTAGIIVPLIYLVIKPFSDDILSVNDNESVDSMIDELIKERMYILKAKYNIGKWVSGNLQSKFKEEDIIKFMFTEEVLPITQHIDAYVLKNQSYGKNIPIFFNTFRSQLEYFHSKDQKELLDLGSGIGMTVWKGLLSGLNVTAVDFAYNEDYALSNLKDYVKSRVPEEIYKKNLVISKANLLDLVEENPIFLEKFDLINIQNVLHFYSLPLINDIVNVLYSLLKPSGRLVITAESANSLGHIKYIKTYNCADIIKESNKSLPLSVSVAISEDYNNKGHYNRQCKKIDTKKNTGYFQEEHKLPNGVTETISLKTVFNQESLRNIFPEDKFKVITIESYSMHVSAILQKLPCIAENSELSNLEGISSGTNLVNNIISEFDN